LKGIPTPKHTKSNHQTKIKQPYIASSSGASSPKYHILMILSYSESDAYEEKREKKKERM
jgi:hypothetical protein